ncbi:MAG TPA: 2-amino-4-hydroxy-6-hydroxymethyldihydropteridine diphosphokinase [Candidatus Krumholzibacteria bacterium]|nr:2-amino-4-hydroxy-6-hydroxymethyldihydropteridine diphosphokinase [Candidatus Krumholzibacteria bacterium]HPD70538.1 2-amino-4-hydroxy-6-hydroxymethyldihydropteridine diphosphokinase [Candidatus Krumholzibacteria bacterium]HRY39762.1 2-amino-4-hydroxy-6-hydroxymethyldihydropteridine diphosphokinase [Candidatus Krumholzibacteria bacterium]
MNRVYLLLGSNVDRERNLPAAVRLLRGHGLTAASPAYETEPVGTGDPAPFLNAAALLVTALGPEDVKRDVCGGVERALGRRRDPLDKFAPRTIDVDIALWNDAAFAVSGSPVPDPDILRHLHAARPLADLAPRLVHPVDGRTLAAIARDLEAETPPARWPRPRPDVDLG